jgi:hypothetical protein
MRPARGVTMLRDIRVASFTHGGGLQQRCPALFTEILEIPLDAFDKRITLRLRGVTEICHVARASRYDSDVLSESGRGLPESRRD